MFESWLSQNVSWVDGNVHTHAGTRLSISRTDAEWLDFWGGYHEYRHDASQIILINYLFLLKYDNGKEHTRFILRIPLETSHHHRVARHVCKCSMSTLPFNWQGSSDNAGNEPLPEKTRRCVQGKRVRSNIHDKDPPNKPANVNLYIYQVTSRFYRSLGFLDRNSHYFLMSCNNKNALVLFNSFWTWVFLSYVECLLGL